MLWDLLQGQGGNGALHYAKIQDLRLLFYSPLPLCAANGHAEQAAAQGDVGILRDLLEGQGVTGALDHAKIEGANSREARSMDAEAARVAQRAADTLRRSRIARQVSIWGCKPCS